MDRLLDNETEQTPISTPMPNEVDQESFTPLISSNAPQDTPETVTEQPVPRYPEHVRNPPDRKSHKATQSKHNT